MDVAMARAAWAVGTGTAQSAPVILEAAFRSVQEARAGWLIPVDPLLNVSAHRPLFDQVLAGLRARAG